MASILAGSSSIMINCGGKAEKQEQTDEAEVVSDTVYACPMHPEVTGKKGDMCPKCEMALEEVKKEEGEEEHKH